MVGQLHLDSDRAAGVFVLTSLAQADAFIAGWKGKSETMVIRPVTYINRLIDPRGALISSHCRSPSIRRVPRSSRPPRRR